MGAAKQGVRQRTKELGGAALDAAFEIHAGGGVAAGVELKADDGTHGAPGGGLKRTLSSVHLVPQPLKYPFILQGYRHGYDAWSAARSFFELHNQTINIWTHFAGFLYFVYKVPAALEMLSSINASFGGYVIYICFLLGGQFQMLASAIYHTFACISEDVDALLLKLDVYGIVAMVAGSTAVGMYNAFYCHPHLFAGYLGTECLLLAVASTLGTLRHWEYATPARNAGFGIAVAFGLIPTLHWLAMVDEHAVAMVRSSLIGMFGFYFLGFVVFVLRIPERFAPGKFDLIGQSHQFWHIFVWLAGAAWCEGMLEYGPLLTQLDCHSV